MVSRAGTLVYVGAILALGTGLLSGLAIAAAEMVDLGGNPPVATLALAALAVILAGPLMICVARDLVELSLYAVLPVPNPLPESELDDEFPAELATCAVYPVIVHTRVDVDALVATMTATHDESGPGPLAHVALVDFEDSQAPHGEHDVELRREIGRQLAAANAGQGDSTHPPLAALFRERRWNPVEETWMGWERKRGKLMEFIDLVTDGLAAETSFEVAQPGDRALVQRLQGTRYLVTLDLGSRLFPGGVRRLVATAAHPDNATVIDEQSETVVSGYGLIRPHHEPNVTRTCFNWAMRNGPHVKRAPSVGQQLLGYDAFFGQGLIDVAAVRAIVRHRIPENSVLSHDKLESLHTRSACQTDVVLIDQTPSDYLAFRQRSHRWIRGDFHLVTWIFGRGGGPGTSGPRSLNLFGRWLLMEDLLSHAHLVSALALLVLGWLVAPASHVGVWTLVVLLLLLAPVVARPLKYLMRRCPPSPNNVSRAAMFAHALAAQSMWWGLWVVLLADWALMTVDAAVRAVYRTLVSRRQILQWTSSAQVSRHSSTDPRAWWRQLWPSPTAALVIAGLVSVINPAGLPWAAPLLVLWLLAPAVAMWVSRPRGWVPRPDA